MDVSDKSHFFSFEIKDWDYGAMTQNQTKDRVGLLGIVLNTS